MREILYLLCLIVTISCSNRNPKYYQNIYTICDNDESVLFSTDENEVIYDTIIDTNDSKYLILTIDQENSQWYFIIYNYDEKELYKSYPLDIEQKKRFIKYDNIFIDDSKLSLTSDGKYLTTILSPYKQRIKSNIIFDLRNDVKHVGFQEASYGDSVLFRVVLGGNHRIIKDITYNNNGHKYLIYVLEDSGQEGLFYLIRYDTSNGLLLCSDNIYLPNYGVYTPDSIDYSYFYMTPDTIAFYLKNRVWISALNSPLVYDTQKIINYYEYN